MTRLHPVALATTLVAASLLSPAVLAADTFLAESPAIYEESGDWSGFSIGVSFGGAFNPGAPGVLRLDQDLDGDFNEPLIAPLLGAFGSNFSGASDASFIAGLSAGYDMQMGDFLIGGIVDISRVDYADRQMAFSSTPASYTELKELDYLATARVRAGFLVDSGLLAYVHGGLAGGDVRYSFPSTNPNGVFSGGTVSTFGYQVGAGFEVMVLENVSLGAEYAYTNLGESSATTRFANGPFDDVNPAGTDFRGSDRIFDFHSIKATLKYHF